MLGFAAYPIMGDATAGGGKPKARSRGTHLNKYEFHNRLKNSDG